MNAGFAGVARPPRVLFLGMQGNFSGPSLRALLESGAEVCAVVLPASPGSDYDRPAIYRRQQPRLARSMLPMLNSSQHSDIVQLAAQHQIAAWEVSRLAHPLTVSTFAAYQPDLICVACFTLRIPSAVLTIPRLGCLNVHPSLLPANRGPLPLFWIFRQGLKQGGVTIHLLDGGMDTGDILAQDVIEIADGVSYSALELQCAARGGAMLAGAAWELYEGRAMRVPQDESKSSRQSFPAAEDYIVPVAEWSAPRVYNFICGVTEWGGPVKLHVGNEYFAAQKAISYSLEDIGNSPGAVYCRRGEELWIRCRVGWVGVINPATFR
jgi:methionyl-tRNA formyltransferase